jgi:hypothetical protein
LQTGPLAPGGCGVLGHQVPEPMHVPLCVLHGPCSPCPAAESVRARLRAMPQTPPNHPADCEQQRDQGPVQSEGLKTQDQAARPGRPDQTDVTLTRARQPSASLAACSLQPTAASGPLLGPPAPPSQLQVVVQASCKPYPGVALSPPCCLALQAAVASLLPLLGATPASADGQQLQGPGAQLQVRVLLHLHAAPSAVPGPAEHCQVL